MDDALDSLLDRLDILDGKRLKLWHEVRDSKGVVVGCHPIAVNPKDETAVDAWEKRCAEMHAEQTITLPDVKPAPQAVIGGIKRTVHVVDAPAVPKFEDLPAEKRRALLKRGD